MNNAQLARFLRCIGHQVEETANGIWDGVGYGFERRLPVYELTPPSEVEERFLFGRRPVVGLYYSLAQGSQGRAGGIYFVRNADYSIPQLDMKERRKTRRGLENCQIRQMGFDELYRLGMPLNLETLARQNRDERLFSDPEHWARFCRTGAEVEGAQAWGSFFGKELATYTVLFRLGDVVNIMYTMSRTELMKHHSSPALTFTVTQTMIRTPGIRAVCYGPEGLSGTIGLDEYKQRMGYQKEPVRFIVQLRPVVRFALLNQTTRQLFTALGRLRPSSDVYQRVQNILDIAALSH